MATSMIFFRAGRGDLDTTAAALAARRCVVRREPTAFGDQLAVRWAGGPELRVVYSREPHVREEADEIGAGGPHANGIRGRNARYEILIDDLDAVLDEINTLIEVQSTLQHATGGYLFNDWNGELMGPDESE